MAKKIEELESEIVRLKAENAELQQENERLDMENVRLLGRNLLMSEQLMSWYELKQRVEWLKAEMERGRRMKMQADLVDDTELLAMLEHRLEKDPHLVTADFGTAELAELMGVSQARLLRLFRNSTIFRSPDEYLENLRLMRAMQLLRDHPEYGIAAISAEAGYNSVRTLQRRMSEVVGMTPVEFRMMTEKDK
jgi:methylphosphotriester-DNA--protein-cysteine methyltransferase